MWRKVNLSYFTAFSKAILTNASVPSLVNEMCQELRPQLRSTCGMWPQPYINPGVATPDKRMPELVITSLTNYPNH